MLLKVIITRRLSLVSLNAFIKTPLSWETPCLQTGEEHAVAVKTAYLKKNVTPTALDGKAEGLRVQVAVGCLRLTAMTV
jgi:hypothetical protein